GLTVFRDQAFTEDERSAAVARIDQVKALRARQFTEDAGPLAHPVRPESYVEINNFYTATVYEKGAEVIRMLKLLVGGDDYRRALDLYFERHDGQACTIEQFRQCFEDVTGRDLSQFALWWHQAGTPRLSVETRWQGGVLTLTLRQHIPATPGQAEKAPMVIPVALGIIGPDGREAAETRIIEITTEETVLDLPLPDLDPGGPAPVPSLLRHFSAPVILERTVEAAERALVLAHDTDPFNRWEAGRRYALDIAHALATGAAAPEGAAVPEAWCEALAQLAGDAALDPAFRALALELPGNDEVAADIVARGGLADPDRIHAALRAMRRRLGESAGEVLLGLYETMRPEGPYSPDAESAGRRALANRALAPLVATGEAAHLARAEAQFDGATNMTDSIGALALLVHHGAPGAPARVEAFRQRWAEDELVMDKWFAVQATAPLPDAVARARALTEDPAFVWQRPNRFRSVVGAFAMGNPVGFHSLDGSGYRFTADWLLRLDALNPQTAARVSGCFESWKRYDEARRGLMQAEMQRIAATPSLSKNTREIVERMLAG
ncbi:MAG: DUF3458 domain-containing protein, partial [Pseudomonadota bacterium]